jgi:hypothetical protein
MEGINIYRCVPPTYDKNVLAVDFFDHPWFHDGENPPADRKKRSQDKFGNKTLWEVIVEIRSKRQLSEYFEGLVTSGQDLVHYCMTPTYDANALAVDFFDHPYFHDGEKSPSALKKRRRDKFGNKTVREVFFEIRTERELSEYFEGLVTSGHDLIRSHWILFIYL